MNSMNRIINYVVKTLRQHLPSILSVGSIYILLPSLAFAYGGDTPVSEGLSYVINAMLGTTGIAIATLAVIAVGLMCLFHVLQWKAFLITIGGIGIVFGSAAIVKGITALISTT